MMDHKLMFWNLVISNIYKVMVVMVNTLLRYVINSVSFVSFFVWTGFWEQISMKGPKFGSSPNAVLNN